MSGKNKKAALIFAAAVLICAAVIIFKGFITSKNRTAVIYLNGEIVREIELDSLRSPVEFEIASDGGVNRVRAERGRIRMLSADCPDKICVKQGWIENGAVPIVCLPHKITIEIRSGETEFDAVTGGV